MLNRVQIAGNLGADPEIRAAYSGSPFVAFHVAVSDRLKDGPNGEPREYTEWIPVVVFNDTLGKIAMERLKKGSMVYLEGKFQTRKFTNDRGQTVHKTEVVLGHYHSKLLVGAPSGGHNPAADQDGKSIG